MKSGTRSARSHKCDQAARVSSARTGGAISPFNSWLILQGIETLPVRMDRHSENAVAVARFLTEHPKVSWVNYPGLPTHPAYASGVEVPLSGVSSAQSWASGSRAGWMPAGKLIESVKLFSHLANIGDAKSLIIHPASTTHSQLTEEEHVLTGVTPDYVRLSVGIETVSDLIDDLDQALAKV